VEKWRIVEPPSKHVMKSKSHLFKLSLMLFLASSCFQSHAQVDLYQRSFFEIEIGVGGSLFLGDLGGSRGSGKMGLLDLDGSSVRHNTSAGIKVNLSNRLSIRGDLFHGRLVGHDKHSGNLGRRDRNLSFRTDITEFSLTSEFIGINLASLGRRKTRTSELYAFAGLGWMHFNPQAEYKGRWYNLRNLGTEGQGLPGGKDLYNLNSFVLPFGIGYRKNIARSTFFGVEVSMRKTFTDYLDDVSGSYYDKDIIRQNRGEVAAELSDRSLSREVEAGTSRGNNRQNDNYSFVQFTVAQGFGTRKAKNHIKLFANQGKVTKSAKCPSFK